MVELPLVYFMTVFTNFFAGVALSCTFIKGRFNWFDKYVVEIMEKDLFRFILGIVTLVFGIFSLGKWTPLDMVIAGDLFPSLTAILAGLILINEYICIQKEEDEEADFFIKVDDLKDKFGIILGFAAMIAAVFHLFIPFVLLL